MCSLLKFNAWLARTGLKPPTVVRSALEGATSRCRNRRSVCPAPAARPPLTPVPHPALTVKVRHRTACGGGVCQLVVISVYRVYFYLLIHRDGYYMFILHILVRRGTFPVSAVVSTSFLVNIETQYTCTEQPDIQQRTSVVYTSYSLSSAVTLENVIARDLTGVVLESHDVAFIGVRCEQFGYL